MINLNSNAKEDYPSKRLSAWRSLLRKVINILLLFILRWRSKNITEYSRLCSQYTERVGDLRKILVHPLNHVSLIPTSKNHTHMKSAMLRTSVSAHFEQVIIAAGLKSYSISKSRRDNYCGTRNYYMIKDLDQPFQFDDIDNEHVLTMIDVDYYLDINEYLKYFRPILIYTFVPQTVAGSSEEYSWYIENNNVVFKASGGAAYKHRVWNYDGDTVAVIDDEDNLLTFSVEQHIVNDSLDPNRRVIALMPRTKTKYPYYNFLNFNVGFKYRNFISKSYNGKDINVIYQPNKDLISLSANGERHSVDINGRLYSSISKRMQNKSNVLPVDIERMLLAAKYSETAYVDGMLLYDLLGCNIRGYDLPETNVLKSHYQTLEPLVFEDGKSSGQVISAPLVENPAIFPVKSVNNDTACVNGRVKMVVNTRVPPLKYNGYAEEFIDCLLNKRVGVGQPFSSETVVEMQNRPAQVVRSAMVKDTMGTLTPIKIRAFQKSESYPTIKYPRNISSMNTELTITLSGYTYAFKYDILDKKPWYMPLKDPSSIEKRLLQIFCNNSSIISTDFDKMDGRVSEWLQKHLVNAIYCRWVSEPYRGELAKYLTNMHLSSARTSNGVGYLPGFSVKSGSPTTTDGNTIINAFISFCALRNLGVGKYNAWASLGLYCGDDGIQGNFEGLAGSLEQTSSDLGMVLKSMVYNSIDDVPFCGRYFYKNGYSMASFCDPIRTLGKLHLSSNKNVSKEQALVNRACGYIVTDHKTPIVSDWCKRVIELYPNMVPVAMLPDELWKLNYPWTQDNSVYERFVRTLSIDSEYINKIIDEIKTSNLMDIKTVIPNDVKISIDSVVDSGHIQPRGQDVKSNLNIQNKRYGRSNFKSRKVGGKRR